MAEGFVGGSSAYNILTQPPQVTALTLTAGNAKIDGSFRAVDAAYAGLAHDYWIVRQAGRIPDHPYDGIGVVITNPSNTSTLSFSLTGLINDMQYGVRVFVRGDYGFQTSPTAGGYATPRGGIQISTLPIGALIKLEENGVGVNYIKVHQGLPSSMYDISCDGAWLLRKEIAEMRQWHSSNVNDYANSTIHSYLNNTFVNRFSVNIRNIIKQVKIPYSPGGGNSMSVNSGSNGLSCKIFLLAGYEMGWTNSYVEMLPADGSKLAYFEFGNNTSANNKRIAYLNGSATRWLSRSPNAFVPGVSTYVVSSGGDCHSNACSISEGVRPPLIFPNDALMKPAPNPDGSYSPLVA